MMTGMISTRLAAASERVKRQLGREYGGRRQVAVEPQWLRDLEKDLMHLSGCVQQLEDALDERAMNVKRMAGR